MEEARLKFMSNDSTLASYQPPGSMYTELIRLAEHSWKKLMRHLNKYVFPLFLFWHPLTLMIFSAPILVISLYLSMCV